MTKLINDKKVKASLNSWCLFSIMILVISGLVYRYCVNIIGNISVKLPISLNHFPYEVGTWSANDIPIPITTAEYMRDNFADDYISRRYINKETQEWADVYFVYCGTRPGGILGHNPTICYPSNGWIYDETQETKFTTKKGKVIDCLIHSFHKPSPISAKVKVLIFYIVNGKLSTGESSTISLSGRKYNYSGNTARYVAQVQISSIFESSIMQIAHDISDIIFMYFPDETGYVRAVEKINN